ncbi:MAG: hypothetical protein HC888_07130, partial [Candidatus Competibacteraceae bacterium]|nr:hypothetical protein [Candidatus Competibacteraceae bacterium]
MNSELGAMGFQNHSRIMTYEGLTKRMKEWKPGQPAPLGIAFDEASRVKNPPAQRSQAARAIADGIRQDHGKDGFVILMSGSPAPKSPLDWWNLCEIACPGFIREGSPEFFQERLGIFKERKQRLAHSRKG